jgi:hypothetical protein
MPTPRRSIFDAIPAVRHAARFHEPK